MGCGCASESFAAESFAADAEDTATDSTLCDQTQGQYARSSQLRTALLYGVVSGLGSLTLSRFRSAPLEAVGVASVGTLATWFTFGRKSHDKAALFWESRCGTASQEEEQDGSTENN